LLFICLLLLSPSQSLQTGSWFKLICGASFQDLPAIRNLALAYALAGADCIDVAAEPAVVAAATAGLVAAQTLLSQARQRGYWGYRLPWLMVSINDGIDPHFRKAVFDPQLCPADCARPCVKICPAEAIAFTPEHQGVITNRCYGCGRCLPICPIQHITEQQHLVTPQVLLPLLQSGMVNAIEIHTQPDHAAEFQKLWLAISPVLSQLSLVAISAPDGHNALDYLRWIANLLTTLDPLPIILWQTDGRPMSGDIGMGTTHAAIALGKKVANAKLPGYVQLAGGTNQYTVAKLREKNLLAGSQNYENFVSGVAYGSYARVMLAPILDQLAGTTKLEENPDILWLAVDRAFSLVSQLKLAEIC
jgi:Fe-S-cluster-containing hydrogenase component 2